MLVPGASAKTEVHSDTAVAVWHNDIMLNCIMVPVNTGGKYWVRFVSGGEGGGGSGNRGGGVGVGWKVLVRGNSYHFPKEKLEETVVNYVT